MTLPDPPPAAHTPTAAYRAMSPDQHRTARRKALLAAGIHPATRLRVVAELGTCGGCAHHHTVHAGNTRAHKCEVAGDTASAASDIRVGWPACQRWEATP